jgi:hypothetical protein
MLLIVLDLVGSAAATVFPLLANAHAISKPSVRRLALSCQSAVRSRQAFGRIVKAPSSGLRVSATETCAAGAQLRYCSSLTFSIRLTALPSSLCWMAMWLIAVVGGALGAAFGV